MTSLNIIFPLIVTIVTIITLTTGQEQLEDAYKSCKTKVNGTFCAGISTSEKIDHEKKYYDVHKAGHGCLVTEPPSCDVVLTVKFDNKTRAVNDWKLFLKSNANTTRSAKFYASEFDHEDFQEPHDHLGVTVSANRSHPVIICSLTLPKDVERQVNCTSPGYFLNGISNPITALDKFWTLFHFRSHNDVHVLDDQNVDYLYDLDLDHDKVWFYFRVVDNAADGSGTDKFAKSRTASIIKKQAKYHPAKEEKEPPMSAEKKKFLVYLSLAVVSTLGVIAICLCFWCEKKEEGKKSAEE